ISFCDPAEKSLLSDIEKHIKSKIKVDDHPFNSLPEKTNSIESKEKNEVNIVFSNEPKTKQLANKSKSNKTSKNKKLPDYLKFKDYKKDKSKPSKNKKKKEDKTFIEYQKKKNPFYQTKKNSK